MAFSVLRQGIKVTIKMMVAFIFLVFRNSKLYVLFLLYQINAFYTRVLALFIPGLAVTIRRLHDINKSGWWLLIALIPLIGSILLIIWLATETKQETNEWGQPAK